MTVFFKKLFSYLGRIINCILNKQYLVLLYTHLFSVSADNPTKIIP